MEEALKKISRVAKMQLSTIPDWFLSPDDINNNGQTLEMGKGFRGTYLDKPVVVKYVTLDTDQERICFLNDAEVWYHQRHQHLVRTFGVCHVSSPCVLVIEDATRGNFAQYFKTESNRGSMWKLFFEALLGILYLHNHGIVHGNLKCNNLLVAADGSAKVSDLGFQRNAATNLSPRIQSDGLRWKAPECIRGEVDKPGFELDVYSFGMCMIEAWTGKVPSDGQSDETIIKAAFDRTPINRPDGMDNTVWSLIESMTRPDPKDRTTMDFAYFELKKLATEEVKNAHDECSNCSMPVSILYRFCEVCGTPRLISTKLQLVELGSNLKSLSVLCDSIQEHQSMCHYVTDRIKLVWKQLARQDEDQYDHVADDEVSLALALTARYRDFLEQLLLEKNIVVEQLVNERTLLERLKSFHPQIDILIDCLNIHEEENWNERWKQHQTDSAKEIRARVMTHDKLLEHVSNCENSLKLLESEMILCHDQEYLPAMQFVRDLMLQKMKMTYAVDIFLTKVTDIAIRSEQKTAYIVLQVGSETQRCKINNQRFSSDDMVWISKYRYTVKIWYAHMKRMMTQGQFFRLLAWPRFRFLFHLVKSPIYQMLSDIL